MELTTHRGTPPPGLLQKWDAFVDAHPRATLYHSSRWIRFAAEAFGFEPAWITAGDPLAGVLPLIRQTSRLFGDRWVSLPFFNYGGPLGRDEAVELRLFDGAVALAQQDGIKRLEIRDRQPRGAWMTRQDKVGAVLALPDTTEALAAALGSKLRSQIRRADRVSPEVMAGGAERVDEFYAVFAETMRDLGTPVYPRRFFAEMFRHVGTDCHVVTLRVAGTAAAAAILTRHRDVTEVPWAASRSRYRAEAINMRLYWECLCHAIRTGSRHFDFGRSTRDGGTHRFKLQWGAVTVPLYWHYPLIAADQERAAAPGRDFAVARRIWRALPVSLATQLGGRISAGLPW
jgi:FemAB-related protein (PEP-CTERM system-associated)